MTLLSRLFRPAPPTDSPEAQSESTVSPAVRTEPAAVTVSDDLARVASAIENGDTAMLCKLTVEGASTKARQAAAEAIHDPLQLKELLKDLRGKDKSVYKIVRAKCDAILAEEKTLAETQNTISAVSAALERHSHLPFDNLFTPTLEHLDTQWQAVAAQAPPDVKLRTEHVIERCRQIVTRHIQEIAGQAARATAIANADNNRREVFNELRKQLAAALANTSADNIAARIETLTERWNDIGHFKAPNRAESTEFGSLRTAVSDVIRLIKEHGPVTSQVAALSEAGAALDTTVLERLMGHASLLNDALPAEIVEANAVLQTYKQAQIDKLAAKEAALRQLGGLIRKAHGALAGGKTSAAAGLRRAIEEKLGHVTDPPAHLTTQLQQLDEKLALLQDWRSYAVAPKRIELIEQMEALIGSEAEPNALAERIKKLQEEWKAISKGSIDNADTEWQRFHQAAQTAYQPCRDYFAAQAKQRQDNLDKRKALLERLQQFTAMQNWEQPNWKEVSRALRESKQQWRNHQPVERAANKPLQERFDTVQAELQTRLDTEFAKNVADRKSLIVKTQQLLTLDDGRRATDEVKRLQAAWKETGLVAREDEQSLWEEFRKHCDAVFAKRQQQHSEHIVALDTNKAKAIVVCEQAERLIDLSGAELVEALKSAPSLREAFAAIGDLPRAQARDLQLRLDRALDRCERKLAEQRLRDKAQAWDNLLSASQKVQAYRLATANGEPAERCESLQQAAQVFIDGIQHWPKGGAQAIKTELSRLGSADKQANEAALRTLCIRAEILTDTPTPDSDQAFRRNYQLQRLKASMGQGQSSSKGELDSMVFEWLTVGAIDADSYRTLQERFVRCRGR